ncbi:copper/zinc superoxide dismutase-like protein [Leptotrombidium deliense]|uniref:Copper/zinc superoxide dismutase-like protein n=1 Tax=Leptotrombidium deliense TaxID=299467 RepID=A0A443SV24_9ACAR|nr:copper/zinc superoxide dismutase-like protein [Leptotrombidium deliense]
MEVTGRLYMQDSREGLRIYGKLLSAKNLSSTHSLRVHEFGDLGDQCSKAGLEFNPVKERPSLEDEKHASHLSHIQFVDSVANVNFNAHKLKLTGVFSIVGRSLVIHHSNYLKTKNRKLIIRLLDYGKRRLH